MTEVEVPFGDDAGDKAVLLLAAAEELNLNPSVIKTTEGAFLVPQEVNDRAFKREEDKQEDDHPSHHKTTHPRRHPQSGRRGPDEPEVKKAPSKKAAKKKVD